jgi:hypothetical protein
LLKISKYTRTSKCSFVEQHEKRHAAKKAVKYDTPQIHKSKAKYNNKVYNKKVPVNRLGQYDEYDEYDNAETNSAIP